MASHTIHGQRWPDGTLVSVYPAAAQPDAARQPSGAAVTTGTVASGDVTFTGLAENVQYAAWAASTGVRFLAPQHTPTNSLRARVDELEAGGGGDGDGGGPSAPTGVFELNVNDYVSASLLTGGGDASAALEALSVLAANEATARSQRVRVHGFAGAEIELSGLRLRSNVEWQLENAILRKTSGTGPLIQAIPLPGSRTFTSISMVGNTAAGSNSVTNVEVTRPTGLNVDRPGAPAVGGAIAGAGVPGGATVTALDAANRTLTLSANATATATRVTLTHNPSFATLSSGSPTVTAVTRPEAWWPGRTVAGTGVPAGATVTAVDWTNPTAPVVTLSANATASGARNLAVTGTTYFGGVVQGARVFGGVLDPNQFNTAASPMTGALLYAKYVEDFAAEGVELLHNHHPSWNGTWAVEVFGYKWELRHLRVIGGWEIHQDGLHVSGGDDGRIIGGLVQSGDDGIALVNTPGSQTSEVDPRAISNVIAQGVVVDCAKGHALRVATEPNMDTGLSEPTGPNFAITDIDVDAVGQAGKYRNPAVGVFDEDAPEGGNRLLKRIRFNGALRMGSAWHDGTSPYGVYVRGADDVDIDCHLTITEGAAPVERWRVRDSDRVTLRLPGQGGTAVPLEARNRNVTVTRPAVSQLGRGGRVEADFQDVPHPSTGTLSSGLSTGGAITSLPVTALPVTITNGSVVHLMTNAQDNDSPSQAWTLTADATAGATSIPVASQTPNFAFPAGGFVVPSHAVTLPAPWRVRRGSNATASGVIFPDRHDGVLRLVPGAAGSSASATDGVILDAGGLGWRAKTSGLAFEARVRITQLAGVAVFIGFTDDRSTMEQPIVHNGTVLVSDGPATACGVIFDPNDPVDSWWLAGMTGGVVTGQSVGVTPIAGISAEWTTWRIEIDRNGAATWMRNGAAVGYAADNSIAGTQYVVPVVAVLGRATGLPRGTVDVDYVAVNRIRG